MALLHECPKPLLSKDCQLGALIEKVDLIRLLDESRTNYSSSHLSEVRSNSCLQAL